MTPSTRHPARSDAATDARRRRLLSAFDAAPFTSAQALAVGLTKNDLRSHTVTPVMRGVYLAGGQRRVDHGVRCAAALALAGDDAWVASLDAARLMRLPVPERERPIVSLPGPLRGRRLADVVLVSRPAGMAGTTIWVPAVRRRLPVTGLLHLVTECADALDLPDLVALADAVLDRAGSTDDARRVWQDGPTRLRRAAALAQIGAGSAMESKVRLLLILAGFPTPVLQHEVVAGGLLFRLDLAYPDLRIAIEYDGAYHFESEAQKHADIRRIDALAEEGWLVLRVVSRGVLRDPAGTLERLRSLFAQRGIDVPLDDAWRRCFAQRDPVRGYVAG